MPKTRKQMRGRRRTLRGGQDCVRQPIEIVSNPDGSPADVKTIKFSSKHGGNVCASCRVVARSITGQYELYDFEGNPLYKGQGKELLQAVWLYIVADTPRPITPILWLGVDMTPRPGHNPYELIRKVYEPLGFYFPGKIPNPSGIPCRDTSNGEREYYVRETSTTPFFKLRNTPAEFISGYKTDIIQEFLDSYRHYDLKYPVTELEWGKGLLLEPGEYSSMYKGRLSSETTAEITPMPVQKTKFTADPCRVAFKPVPQDETSPFYLQVHTHPKICYKDRQAIIGWQSVFDMISSLEQFTRDNRVVGQYAVAREGVYYYQMHPFLQFLVKTRRLRIDQAVLNTLYGLISDVFSNDSHVNLQQVRSVFKAGGLEAFKSLYGKEPVLLPDDVIFKLAELTSPELTREYTPEDVALINKVIPNLLTIWLSQTNINTFSLANGMRVPVFSCQFLPDIAIRDGKPFKFTFG